MIRIGIAGLGRLGRIHLEQLSGLEHFHIGGLYDIDRSRAEAACNGSRIPVFDRYEDLLEACGAVLIATPTSSHFHYAESAIRSGRHVFIEKPITGDTAAAAKLIDLAEEAGSVIQVGHVERFNPAFRAVRHLDLRPRFIESHRLAQYSPRGTDVSVVLDLMIHDLDIILSLVDANVRRIHASGVAVVTSNIDIANARLEFDNGTVANLTASRISFKRMRKMRLFQENAYIGIDFLEKKVDHVRLSPNGSANGIPLTDAPAGKQVILEKPVVKEDNAIREELRAFGESIRTGKQPEVGAAEATAALQLAHEILRKIERNYHLSE